MTIDQTAIKRIETLINDKRLSQTQSFSIAVCALSAAEKQHNIFIENIKAKEEQND